MAKSFEEAQFCILENVQALDVQQVPLLQATGQIIAEDVLAPHNMPNWDNSAMDGFAVRSQDCNGKVRLNITGYLPAGDSADGLLVTEGTAIIIMTGAPVPEGCDAIVPFEEAEEDGDSILVKSPISHGNHIRYCGEDFQVGELSIAVGTKLCPAEISLLAAFGKTSVQVYRRPRVAILSTGNELVESGASVTTGKIVDSNSFALAAAVQDAGGEPVLIGIARDEIQDLRAKISEGLQADVLLTSAGVSMGDKNLVRDVLSDLKVQSLFWKIQIKPGRLTAFGLWGKKPVFSLPGNPVSSLLTFEMFVRPALLKMMGVPNPVKPFISAKLHKAVSKKAGRVNFMRVRVEKHGRQLIAFSSGDQNTGILKTLLKSNAIAILPADQESFSAGEEVNIHLLSNEMTTKESSTTSQSYNHNDMNLVDSILTHIGM